MTYIMKKERAFWVSVCLLLSVSELLNALPEEADGHADPTDEGSSYCKGFIEGLDREDSEGPSMKPKHTFCAMKADDGPCKAMIRSYFFNIFTQQCEKFIYGGCGGNENRFHTLEECRETCIKGYKNKTVKTISGAEKPDFCFLEEDPGICRGLITRYFYNNQSKKCERFKYGGCLGNLNNFETLEACKDTCEDTENELQKSHYTSDLNTVNNTLTPPSTKVVSQWEYHGPSWCLSPADSGLCQAKEKRFYFNSVIGKCRQFKYTGCGGNNNNFMTRRDCVRACKKGFIKRISKGAGRGDVTGSGDVSLLPLITYNLTTLLIYSERVLSPAVQSCLRPSGSVAGSSPCLQDHIARLTLFCTSSAEKLSPVESQKIKFPPETISHRISLGAVLGSFFIHLEIIYSGITF
ncbi:tissue factor pathway inhibitor isoform X1 [Sigmodon hispidus]